jgi:hypothetical protein
MRLLLTCAAVLATAGLLPAQIASPPIVPGSPITPQPTAPFPDLQKYLNLTDSQVSALVGIQQQQQQSLTQFYQQLSDKEQTLQSLLQAPSPNPMSIGQTMIDIQSLQKQISQLSTEPYHTQALAVLNQNQLTLLANLTTALQLLAPAYQAASAFLIAYPQSGQIGVLKMPPANLSALPPAPAASGGH